MFIIVLAQNMSLKHMHFVYSYIKIVSGWDLTAYFQRC